MNFIPKNFPSFNGTLVKFLDKIHMLKQFFSKIYIFQWIEGNKILWIYNL